MPEAPAGAPVSPATTKAASMAAIGSNSDATRNSDTAMVPTSPPHTSSEGKYGDILCEVNGTYLLNRGSLQCPLTWENALRNQLFTRCYKLDIPLTQATAMGYEARDSSALSVQYPR